MSRRFTILHGKGVVLVLSLALVLGVATYQTQKAPPVRFTSPEELRDLALDHGLHWHPGSIRPGSVLPEARSGYYLTDRPVPLVELDRLCKARCGAGPEWDGVLWVIALEHPDFSPSDVSGACRIWGGIFVAGDERLMARVEALYRQAPRSRGKAPR